MRLGLVLFIASLGSAASVTQSQYTASNSGANTSEVILDQATVSGIHFGLLAKLPITGQGWNQPLVVEGVTISGAAQTLVVVVTAKNNAYAFRSDTYALIWSRTNLGGDPGSVDNRPGAVVDPATNLLYLYTQDASSVVKLWCLNLADGTNAVSPVTVAATSGARTFDATQQNIHPAPKIASGKVYLCFGASTVDETNAYVGWVMAYNKTTLAQTNVFITANGDDGAFTNGGAGVWQAGVGPAIDSSGNLYLITGNGAWDGSANFGETFLKLSPTLALVDWFTRSDWSALNAGDLDVGSGHIILISDSVAFGMGKTTPLFLLRTSDMGHLQGGGGTAPLQSLTTPNGIQPGLVYANSDMFLSGPGLGGTAPIYRFAYNGSTFATSAAAQSAISFQYPGCTMAYSSNGNTAGTQILWANCTVDTSNPKTCILRAYNPSDMSVLWSSGAKAFDGLGTCPKWATPTVVNGKVFAQNASGYLAVYGIQPVKTLTSGGLFRGLP